MHVLISILISIFKPKLNPYLYHYISNFKMLSRQYRLHLLKNYMKLKKYMLSFCKPVKNSKELTLLCCFFSALVY